MKRRVLLIDADSAVYLSAKGSEKVVQWSPWLWTRWADLDEAIVHVDDFVAELKEKLEADDVVMALSDYNDPWRKRVMATYKANRAATEKPIVFQALREYIHEKFNTFQRPGLEGDDILGILMTREAGSDEEERICLSIDKDLKTIPGKHFNFGKVDRAVDWTLQIREVNQESADRYHMTQTLTGDTTDGYKGCPKVGPVSAEKILGDAVTYEEMWPLVVAAYKKAGLSEDVALQNARVARICRAEDFDFSLKAVRPWNPPR